GAPGTGGPTGAVPPEFSDMRLAGPPREAPALILSASGTTGALKGVMRRHGNLLANAMSVIAYLQLGPGDSVLSVLPFYYAYGASVLHTHLASGARVVLAPNLVFLPMITAAIAR